MYISYICIHLFLLFRAAKQKSIAVLNAKMKKNNLPCLFYTRFGYCKRRDSGTCEKVHDPINITICKK